MGRFLRDHKVFSTLLAKYQAVRRWDPVLRACLVLQAVAKRPPMAAASWHSLTSGAWARGLHILAGTWSR